MIGSDILTEHHLTPRGWEAGNLPNDRVETWTRRIFEDLSAGCEEVHWCCEWAAPEVSRADRDAIRAKNDHFMWESTRCPGLIVSIGGACLTPTGSGRLHPGSFSDFGAAADR